MVNFLPPSNVIRFRNPSLVVVKTELETILTKRMNILFYPDHPSEATIVVQQRSRQIASFSEVTKSHKESNDKLDTEVKLQLCVTTMNVDQILPINIENFQIIHDQSGLT